MRILYERIGFFEDPLGADRILWDLFLSPLIFPKNLYEFPYKMETYLPPDEVFFYLPWEKISLLDENPEFAYKHLKHILGTSLIKFEDKANYSEINEALMVAYDIPYSPQNVEKFWEYSFYNWVSYAFEFGSLEVAKFLLEVIYRDLTTNSEEELYFFESLATTHVPTASLYRYLLEFIIKESSEELNDDEEGFIPYFLRRSFKNQIIYEDTEKSLSERIEILQSYGFDPRILLKNIQAVPDDYDTEIIEVLSEKGFGDLFDNYGTLRAYARENADGMIPYLLEKFEYTPRTIDLVIKDLISEGIRHPEPLEAFLLALLDFDPHYKFIDPQGYLFEALQVSEVVLRIILRLGVATVEGDEIWEAYLGQKKIDPGKAARIYGVLEDYGTPSERVQRIMDSPEDNFED